LPPRWVVPASLKCRLRVLAHFSKAAGHPGTTKMAQTLSRLWYWHSMAKDCLGTVRRCPSFAAKNLKRSPKKTTPLTIFPPNRPLEHLAMDVLGPLPTTSRGNRFVLCIGDRFSKMSVAVDLPKQTASAVAQALMDRWIAVFGIPLTVLTDNCAAFTIKPLEATLPLGEILLLRRTCCLQAQSPIPRGW
jgi:hypothetical protein